MGCDIHIFVERKEGDKWVSADKWTPNKYYDPAEPEGEKPLVVDYDDRIYRGRNYDLFGILANVRNGRGFAGIVTGKPFTPISMPKGLPGDVSDEVRSESDYWEGDGHSHSWLTLAELEAYDWKGQSTAHRGWVDEQNFELWQKEGKPHSWSGGVSGGLVKHISNEEMRVRVHQKQAGFTKMEHGGDEAGLATITTGDCSYYTTVEWTESYEKSVEGVFTNETLPRLRELANGDAESVRLVFWFDN